MQKIVFCDLDKTLIFGNHLHSPKDLASLREFQRSGNLLVCCTAALPGTKRRRNL